MAALLLRSFFRPTYRMKCPELTKPLFVSQLGGGNSFGCTLATNTRLLCEAIEGEKANEERDPTKDRSKVIPVETSMKYMKSKAYQSTYGSDPVWKKYRRNFKGAFAPHKTRKTCIRANMISTGNPCPICRDEYLVLDHRNVDLLKQFISPHNGEVLPYGKTNICQKRHRELSVAVERARDMGLLTFDVPFREYDYSEYYSPEENAGKSAA